MIEVKNSKSDRGLSQDKGDLNRWKHDRDRLHGYDYAGEYNQYKPFIFSAESNVNYADIGIYKGATAFLIGGGPSFAKLDQSLLKNCFTMVMNNSVKNFRADMMISVDDPSRFLLSAWLDPKIKKFTPFSNAEKPLWDSRYILGKQNDCPAGIIVRQCPNVYFFRRNSKFHGPRFFTESTINWGCSKHHGGCRSVMISALRILFLLGFRKVYLLGVDLDMSPEARYHFSDGRTTEGVRGNQSTYNRMNKEYMPSIKKEGKRYGFQVYNCNKESNLKTFEYVPYEKAVQDATLEFGDISKENTEGMYCPFEEKMTKYNKRVNKEKG